MPTLLRILTATNLTGIKLTDVVLTAGAIPPIIQSLTVLSIVAARVTGNTIQLKKAVLKSRQLILGHVLKHGLNESRPHRKAQSSGFGCGRLRSPQRPLVRASAPSLARSNTFTSALDRPSTYNFRPMRFEAANTTLKSLCASLLVKSAVAAPVVCFDSLRD